MDKYTNHRMTICTTCTHKGTTCRPGYALIEKLRTAIQMAGDAVAEDFEISGVASLAGCDRLCTVAYHSARKATYLFGDIDPDVDIGDLVAVAQQYAQLNEGWSSASDRPEKLRNTSLARVPAAVIAIEASDVRAS